MTRRGHMSSRSPASSSCGAPSRGDAGRPPIGVQARRNSWARQVWQQSIVNFYTNKQIPNRFTWLHCVALPSQFAKIHIQAEGRQLIYPPVNGRFLLAQPIFYCRVWQRGAKWHRQSTDQFEVVLASGIAENQLAARNAAVLHCLHRVSNPSGPN